MRKLLILVSLLTSLTCLGQGDSTKSDVLSQKLIKAQTDYYLNQTKEKSEIASILSSLLGTLLGAGLALLGVRWSTNRQWELEKDKWNQTQALEREKWEKALEHESINEVRIAAATLAKILAAQNQAIMWLTWIGLHEPKVFSTNDIANYNADMKKLFREEVVAEAYLAALQPGLYIEMGLLAKQVSSIDYQVTVA
ncbi:hypothetical protein [uncultured Hymenobacter sp.]|uniref:hypothetical protein n=1 Tax=uncultured Hymenobacter sp. TaxID=170016 RepID=UPI0035CB9C33